MTVTPWWSFLGMNINTEIKIGVRSWSAGKKEPAWKLFISLWVGWIEGPVQVVLVDGHLFDGGPAWEFEWSFLKTWLYSRYVKNSFNGKMLNAPRNYSTSGPCRTTLFILGYSFLLFDIYRYIFHSCFYDMCAILFLIQF